MNTNTITNIRKICDVWLVEAQTPDGARLLVNHVGTEKEAIGKARQAEAEPA